MITLTRRAKDLVAAYRRRAPEIQWCVLIAWAGSEADNFRSSGGAQVWTRTVPVGWTASVCPYIPAFAEEYRFTEVDGVMVGLRAETRALHPFAAGAAIDAEGSNLCIVP